MYNTNLFYRRKTLFYANKLFPYDFHHLRNSNTHFAIDKKSCILANFTYLIFKFRISSAIFYGCESSSTINWQKSRSWRENNGRKIRIKLATTCHRPQCVRSAALWFGFHSVSKTTLLPRTKHNYQYSDTFFGCNKSIRTKRWFALHWYGQMASAQYRILMSMISIRTHTHILQGALSVTRLLALTQLLLFTLPQCRTQHSVSLSFGWDLCWLEQTHRIFITSGWIKCDEIGG